MAPKTITAKVALDTREADQWLSELRSLMERLAAATQRAEGVLKRLDGAQS